MNEITIQSVTTHLTHLDLCRERVANAEESLERARSKYAYAIRLLEEAMELDDTILQCQALVDEYQDLYTQALHNTQESAITAWESGFTNGGKEWAQDGWEVRLRTLSTPTVVDVEKFIDDVHTLRAHSVISKVSLNKKAAVELHQTAGGGVRGLEVTESTSCSLRKMEENG